MNQQHKRDKTFIDLYAGCGGMSLGFTRAGFVPLGGLEVDEKAALTHAENFFGDEEEEVLARHKVPRDITCFPPNRFLEEILQTDTPAGLVDVIVGGPPCQAFSRVGRAKLREIMEHPEAFLQDERANLYIHFLEYVSFFEPKAVVMENVPDIMNFGGQNVAAEIALSLEDLGYCVRYTILNAAYYGVPQLRQRFYLIGLRSDLKRTPTFPAPTHYITLPKGYKGVLKVALNGIAADGSDKYFIDPLVPNPELTPAVTAREALQDLPEIDISEIGRGRRKFDALAPYSNHNGPSLYGWQMRCWPGFESQAGVWDHVTRFLPRDFKIFNRMEPGDQYPEAWALANCMFEEILDEHEANTGLRLQKDEPVYELLEKFYVPPYDPSKFPNKWWKMEPDQPSRTLTAHIGKDTYSHIHYDQPRTISVREAARLQSFPDGFTFSGAMNAAFRQIGNAVPPLQAYALALIVKEQLADSESEADPESEQVLS